MMQNPLISIVIPAYNSSCTIKKAVASALNQTYKNIEVIVVDDASEDDTADIIKNLSKTDSRIHAIYKDKNGGVSAARNTGINAANGEWLITLDGDDYFDEGMAEKLLKTVLENDSDVCICGFRTVFQTFSDSKKTNQNIRVSSQNIEKGSRSFKENNQNTGENNQSIKGNNKNTEESDHNTLTGESFKVRKELTAESKVFLSEMLTELYDKHLISTHSNKIYKMDIIRKNDIYYDEKLAVNEDIDFVLRYLYCCSKMSAVEEVYLNYLQHDTGKSLITTFRENGIEGALLVLRDYKKLIERSFEVKENIKDENDLKFGINPTSKNDIKLEKNLMDKKDTMIGDNISGKNDTKTEKNLNNNKAFKKQIEEMNERMFIHICSFVGIMYKQSGYSDAKKIKVLKELFGNADFRMLIKETKPKNVKDALALFLIKTGAIMPYHILCELMYKHTDI